MAREQRKDVDYFPHDCTHGRKMHIIETRYGNDGYSTWFKLLEQLGKANNHYIDISDEMTLMFLVSLFKISEEKTLNIFSDLAKLGSIDKSLYENYKIIWSKKFSESVADAYRNRKGIIFQYSDILNEIQAKKVQSYASLTHNEVNLTEVILKEDKSKVKESKKDIFSLKKNLLEIVKDNILVSDYISLRKSKKASMSETFFNSLKKECDDNNFELSEALKICIDKSWVGFKYTWVKNVELQNKEKSNGKQVTNAKPNYRNVFTSTIGNNEQTKSSNIERELSEDTSFTIVE